jgi:hypothetical protein
MYLMPGALLGCNKVKERFFVYVAEFRTHTHTYYHDCYHTCHFRLHFVNSSRSQGIFFHCFNYFVITKSYDTNRHKESKHE